MLVARFGTSDADMTGTEQMRDYTVFIDANEEPGIEPTYQISICPFVERAPSVAGGSAMAYKNYPTREALEAEMRRYFGFTDASIQRYSALPELHQALVHPLSDEVAAYFGWS